MKRAILIILLSVPLVAFGQNEQIPKFAFTFNPLGFVQFGPFVGAEIRLEDNLVLNLHSRIASFGLLSYVVREADKITGFSVGAGPIKFFGNKQHKPYVGLLIEYEKLNVLYSEGYSYENTETENNIVFITNGGYRFRFSGGFFVNTGAYLGVAKTSWVEVFTDSYYEGSEGSGIRPFGMLELTVGLEL